MEQGRKILSIRNDPTGAPLPESTATNETRWAWPEWLWTALLTAAYLVISLWHIQNLGLIDPDEPRYAGAGRTMAEGGSLLTPQFNGAPRINKPPLFYWVVALSDKTAGQASETSARIPSVVMGLLMLWGTIWLGRRVFGARTGLLAGTILLTCPLYLTLARCCITDMTLSTFMAGSLGLILLCLCGLLPARRAGWIAAFLLGCAVLTKATAALAVVLVVVVARALALPAVARPAVARWMPWTIALAMLLSLGALQFEVIGKKTSIARNKAEAAARAEAEEPPDADQINEPNAWQALDRILNLTSLALAGAAVAVLFVMAYRAERRGPVLPGMWGWGLALAIGMGAWWYVVLIIEQGLPHFLELFHFEVNQRLAGAVHREGMYYYLILLPAVTLPWAIGLPGAIAAAWPSENEGAGSPTETRADTFLLAWIGGIVIFFSIPGAKLATYVLPAMPAVALLTARFLEKLRAEKPGLIRAPRAAVQIIACLMALVLLALPFWIKWLPQDASNIVDAILGRWRGIGIWAVAAGTTAAFAGGWIWAVNSRTRWAPLPIALGLLGLLVIAVDPAIGRLNQRSTKEVCAKTRDGIAGCTRIISLGVAPEGLSYYLEQPVLEMRMKHSAGKQSPAEFFAEIAGGPQQTALFIEKRYYARVFGRADWKSVKPEEMEAKLPANLKFIYSNQNVLVVRNKL